MRFLDLSLSCLQVLLLLFNFLFNFVRLLIVTLLVWIKIGHFPLRFRTYFRITHSLRLGFTLLSLALTYSILLATKIVSFVILLPYWFIFVIVSNCGGQIF